MLIDDFISFLCCPDCNGDLKKVNSELMCDRCEKNYRVYNDICIEIMPSKKAKLSGQTEIEERYITTYNRLFEEKFVWKEKPNPWGLAVSPKYVLKLKKHKYVLSKLIPQKIRKFIDISAGSGRFSYELAERCHICVLCDISVDSVVYLTKKTLEDGKENILILRMDYTCVPFKRGSFDVCMCNDTLIYGIEHEKLLLSSIYKILTKDGIALLDFSNKYHRGFWHKPYTYGYSKAQMVKMLHDANFHIKDIVPLYYELSKDLDENKFVSRMFRRILPPTRYIFKCSK